MKTPNEIKTRLEYLRGELRLERISFGELHELQSLAPHIEKGDTELLEAAGVPEYSENQELIQSLSPSDYDIAAMLIDERWGNFSPENVEDYRHENIVQASFINGQFSQAKAQCREYGLDYNQELKTFKSSLC